MKKIEIFIVVYLASANIAAAQDVRPFQTYTQALDTLLAPNDQLGFSIDDKRMSCPSLSGDINELHPGTYTDNNSIPSTFMPVPTSGSLGSNLSQHCAVESNIPIGSSLSAGFSSVLPTRTYLSFGTDRRRATKASRPASSNSPPSKNFLDTSLGAFNLSGGGDETAFRISLNYVRDETKDTLFESGSTTSGIAGFTAIEFRTGADGFYGVGVSFEAIEGTTNPSRPLLSREFDPADYSDNTIFAAYQNACNTIRPGTQDKNTFSLHAYGQHQLNERTTINFQTAASYSKGRYENGLCIISFQDIAGPLFAGSISGETNRLEFSGEINLQTQLNLGRLQFFPSIGATFAHGRTSGYTETEVPINSVIDFLEPIEDIADPKSTLTGASLKYDAQSDTSLALTLGAAMVVPLSFPNSTGAFFADARYVKNVLDRSQTVTAQFAEDFRDTPTRFSFERNPLPSDYFEVGLGVQNTSRSGNATATLSIKGILGDEVRDSYGVSASFRMLF